MLAICGVISLKFISKTEKKGPWARCKHGYCLLTSIPHTSLTGLSHHYTSLHTHLVTKRLLFCMLMARRIIQLLLFFAVLTACRDMWLLCCVVLWALHTSVLACLWEPLSIHRPASWRIGSLWQSRESKEQKERRRKNRKKTTLPVNWWTNTDSKNTPGQSLDTIS